MCRLIVGEKVRSTLCHVPKGPRGKSRAQSVAGRISPCVLYVVERVLLAIGAGGCVAQPDGHGGRVVTWPMCVGQGSGGERVTAVCGREKGCNRASCGHSLLCVAGQSQHQTPGRKAPTAIVVLHRLYLKATATATTTPAHPWHPTSSLYTCYSPCGLPTALK